MTVTLELTRELEEQIVAEARAEGLSVEAYLLLVIARRGTIIGSEVVMTGAERTEETHMLAHLMPNVATDGIVLGPEGMK